MESRLTKFGLAAGRDLPQILPCREFGDWMFGLGSTPTPAQDLVNGCLEVSGSTGSDRKKPKLTGRAGYWAAEARVTFLIYF